MKVVDEVLYLGYVFHAYKPPKPGGPMLAISGNRAQYALQQRVVLHDLFGPEIKLRLVCSQSCRMAAKPGRLILKFTVP